MRKFVYIISLVTLLALLLGGLSFVSPLREGLGNIPLKTAEKHPKLDSALSQLIASYKRTGRFKSKAQQLGLNLSEGRVKVVVEVKRGKVNTAIQQINSLGGKVEVTYQNLVQALVPVSSLKRLAESPEVKFIRRPFKPHPVGVMRTN